MALLIDTHTLVWLAEDNPKLSRRAREAITGDEADLAVSAITAFELEDLRHRRRIPASVDLERLIVEYDITVLDVPCDIWRLASELPYVHGDPVDRMLVAHAIVSDFVLVTADHHVPSYPVRTLW